MRSELNRLRELLWQTPSSAAKVALLEQAIQIADSIQDIDAGFILRYQFIEAAWLTGVFPEKILVAFSWNLAQVDRDPKRYPEVDLFWEYKWSISLMLHMPQISLGQIEEALADFTRRLERNGASLRPVNKLRVKIASHVGNREQVLALLPLWKKCRRDEFSDCQTCDRNTSVAMYSFLGQHRRALQMAQPLLEKKDPCRYSRRKTYAQILITLLRLNRREEGAEYHRVGYRLVKDDPHCIVGVPKHLLYLILTQDITEAINLFESYLCVALASSSPLNRYFFWEASLFLFQRLRKAPKTKRRFRLPESFPLWNDRGTYDLCSLEEWFEREARTLAQQFDARNGNTSWMDKLDKLEQLENLIQPIFSDTE